MMMMRQPNKKIYRFIVSEEEKDFFRSTFLPIFQALHEPSAGALQFSRWKCHLVDFDYATKEMWWENNEMLKFYTFLHVELCE